MPIHRTLLPSILAAALALAPAARAGGGDDDALWDTARDLVQEGTAAYEQHSSPAPAEPRPPWPLIAGAAAVVLVAGAGVGAGLAARGRDTGDGTVLGGFVAGGVATTAIGLGVWALAGAAQRRAPRIRVLPVASAGGGAVLVRGTW